MSSDISIIKACLPNALKRNPNINKVSGYISDKDKPILKERKESSVGSSISMGMSEAFKY